MPGVWWAKFSPDGRNVNQLTPQIEADMGSGACFYDVTAFIEPSPADSRATDVRDADSRIMQPNETRAMPVGEVLAHSLAGTDFFPDQYANCLRPRAAVRIQENE